MEKTIKLVPGTKVSIETNEDGSVVLVYEPEEKPQFKDGDIIYCSYNSLSIGLVWVTIVRKQDRANESRISYYARYLITGVNEGELKINDYQSVRCDVIRLATEEEKQLLFDALAKNGKQWNAEKKCIEDLMWEPKRGEAYFFIDDEIGISHCFWTDESIDENRYKVFNCFRNEQDADEALPHIKEAFRNWNKK